MSSSSQESARDAAMQPGLLDVVRTVEAWARESRNGAKVWEVAGELLPEMWENWRFCLGIHEWSQSSFGGALSRTLTQIAIACDDQHVGNAVATAKSAIALYRDPQ